MRAHTIETTIRAINVVLMPSGEDEREQEGKCYGRAEGRVG